MQQRTVLLIIFCFVMQVLCAQGREWSITLHTAKASTFMTEEEKNMIFEINKIRSAPPEYAKEYIYPRLTAAKEVLRKYGKGSANYSVVTTHLEQGLKRDTVWYYLNEEEVFALQTLYDTLMHLKPLSILLPDKGIYNACNKHANDQQKNGSVSHQGNDGSWPWDRITKFSPKMKTGNENIAYNSHGNYKDIVLQLLIDSGIGGYGHRYNMLHADWTHIACYQTKKPAWEKQWWIQNYGEKK